MSSQQTATPMVTRTVGEIVELLSERACALGLTEAEAALSATHDLGKMLRRVDRATRRRLLRHTR